MFSEISDPRVASSRLPETTYEAAGGRLSLNEAIVDCASSLGWSSANGGAFGNLIEKGSRVVLKPNWVLHANQGEAGLLPLVTHSSVVSAVMDEVLKADPAHVIVGDAPIQMCDWNALIQGTGIDVWSEKLRSVEPRFKGLVDFRRTTCTYTNGVRVASEGLRRPEDYVLFNLRGDSLLEPITDAAGRFRVTSYDPRLMQQTHSPNNHQYLIAREVLEADVVVNLPKLKTHKKAGISCALKNLVGINGNKEYLPHHRVGGSAEGGDCYPGRDRIKRGLEALFDRRNMSKSAVELRSTLFLERVLRRLLRLKGDRVGVEGAWSGNETVARMTIDLNRILLYGRTDGTLGEVPQRRIINVVDAVIAGQGEGPLANDELPLGLIVAGSNQAAVDMVGARLLGYDASRIPTLRLAFDEYRWPITAFRSEEVVEVVADRSEEDEREGATSRKEIRHPIGWTDALAANRS